MKEVFDINPGGRTQAQWRHILTELTATLSNFLQVVLTPTSWVVDDDLPGDRASSNCVNVRGVVNKALNLDACGVVCVSGSFGNPCHASADLLLFSCGRRVLGPEGLEIMCMLYHPTGWVSDGWRNGECSEWEGYATDERWRLPL